jgi:hypothetical protein
MAGDVAGFALAFDLSMMNGTDCGSDLQGSAATSGLEWYRLNV